MHAHDRTMLAKLGFADPDKSSDLHELACQFLIQPEIAMMLGTLNRPEKNQRKESFFREESVKHSCTRLSPRMSYALLPGGDSGLGEMIERETKVSCKLTYEYDRTVLRQARVELPIGKGVGDYQTTIGFCDIFLEFDYVYILKERGNSSGHKCSWCDREFSEWPSEKVVAQELRRWGWDAVIEVKIGRIPVSDAIRQINMYRQYEKNRQWILATPWELGPYEMELLEPHRIRHVLLGDRFNQFCNHAKSQSAAESAMKL